MKNNLLLITYDLSNPGRNYEALIKLIKQSSGWARLGGSSYLVVTPLNVSALRDHLLQALDTNDKIYVGKMDQPAAWYGMGDEISNWIKNSQN